MTQDRDLQLVFLQQPVAEAWNAEGLPEGAAGLQQ